MSYVNRMDIEAEFDDRHLISSLDDNGDGAEDAGLFDRLAASVDAKLTGYIDLFAQIGIPALPATLLRYYARVMMCCLLFRRRGVAAEMNPFAEREDEIIKQLDFIADGETDIAPRSFTMLTTTTGFHRFGDFDDAPNGGSQSGATCGDVTLAGPDGRCWRLKIKYLSGQPVHYWEEAL